MNLGGLREPMILRIVFMYMHGFAEVGGIFLFMLVRGMGIGMPRRQIEVSNLKR
jgi:hypothetical protein